MGLVGLLVMDPMTGPPRVAGMKGQVVGYVVSHPGLQAKPWVRRNGQTLPVLAFKLTVVIAQADGIAGFEELRGHGKLDVFYNPDGFSDTLLSYPRTLKNSQKIEVYDVEFRGNVDFDTEKFFMRLHETALATRPFSFDGRVWRTPVSLSSRDVLVGEYSRGFESLVIASRDTMPPLSPQEKLIALVGSPQRIVRY